ncbi:MAG: hypothetical protein BWZ04_03099 [Firmicutes bacterium ADurb.BinA205]|nr:MAG: hypothetical protein BWZ04_03099 [Firmicutes bacterium ADurb.BinA205]
MSKTRFDDMTLEQLQQYITETLTSLRTEQISAERREELTELESLAYLSFHAKLKALLQNALTENNVNFREVAFSSETGDISGRSLIVLDDSISLLEIKLSETLY